MDSLHTTIIGKLSHRILICDIWPGIGLREAFCFEILSGYIEKIGRLSLDALEKYYQIIQLLCKPCHWYISQYRGSSTPEEIINVYANETSPLESMSVVVSFRSKYFKHMRIIYEELLSWKTKIEKEDMTYSEICIYSQKVASIQKVAKAMFIPDVVVIAVHEVRQIYDCRLEELRNHLFYCDQNGLW